MNKTYDRTHRAWLASLLPEYSYDVKDKFAIVTGAGSGINHAFVELLLEAGCSVIIADIQLGPEAEATITKHCKDSDPIDAKVGQYKTFAVNTTGPIRLAQIAIDYWLQNRNIEGNLLWIASLGGYVHSMHTPMYFASKAAIVSMVKSLGGLRKELGIRNAAVCPGAVYTPIFHPEYCRDRVRPDDLTLTPQQCAAVLMRVLCEPEFGDGNVVETMLVGSKDDNFVSVREVPLHLLYPTAGPVGQDNHLLEEEVKMVKQLKEHGMRA
ncbi:hypothetical protein JMJ77_0010608 [Colletotrichum scovillei]|uniref:Short chain dehydrogenase n=1 Tax=Colletotrichum scovillei TaxID=1209932 RepID=A0A9P7R452_9PEZI|nr:hypothetical protein JMJ77_0010608 [Colletotrichum scovillei]KAG7059571.1 hypothetical protein JMJ78_0014862 [Colletotrichum scovillei]